MTKNYNLNEYVEFIKLYVTNEYVTDIDIYCLAKFVKWLDRRVDGNYTLSDFGVEC